MKEIETLILCVYGVILHLENVRRILKKRAKHSPRALSHHKRTRLIFYFFKGVFQLRVFYTHVKV